MKLLHATYLGLASLTALSAARGQSQPVDTDTPDERLMRTGYADPVDPTKVSFREIIDPDTIFIGRPDSLHDIKGGYLAIADLFGAAERGFSYRYFRWRSATNRSYEKALEEANRPLLEAGKRWKEAKGRLAEAATEAELKNARLALAESKSLGRQTRLTLESVLRRRLVGEDEFRALSAAEGAALEEVQRLRVIRDGIVADGAVGLALKAARAAEKTANARVAECAESFSADVAQDVRRGSFASLVENPARKSMMKEALDQAEAASKRVAALEAELAPSLAARAWGVARVGGRVVGVAFFAGDAAARVWLWRQLPATDPGWCPAGKYLYVVTVRAKGALFGSAETTTSADDRTPISLDDLRREDALPPGGAQSRPARREPEDLEDSLTEGDILNILHGGTPASQPASSEPSQND
jgi:hypothetical protein